MKNIRLVGMALLALFMSVSFSACGGSDDDDNNGGGGDTSSSIEGTWYLKSEKWFTDESMKTVSGEKTYGDYANERVWTFKKSGNDLILTQKSSSGYTNEYTLVRNGNNDYQKGNDRFVVKTLTSNSLVVDYYDNYYDDDKSLWEYGVYTFMR